MSPIRWVLCPEPCLRRFVSLIIGLVVFGFSLALLVAADLGLDPWDVLHQGIARSLGVRLGGVVVLTSLFVLVAWIPLRQRPGLGTVLNALLIGVVFEAAIAMLPELESLTARATGLVAAIGLNAVATGLYIGAGLGPGPRDGLMTGLAAKGWPIRRVRTLIELTVLGVGWALGGTVGVGTVVFAAAIGPLVHVVLPIFTIAESTIARKP